MKLCDDHTWVGQGECPECKANDDVAFPRSLTGSGLDVERLTEALFYLYPNGRWYDFDWSKVAARYAALSGESGELT